MFIRPEAFVDDQEFGHTKTVSTEINKELQQKLHLTDEELDLVLRGDVETLEQFSPIDRIN